MYEAFVQRDALRIEINPLIIDKDQRFYAANCQVKIDPDATYRQQELQMKEDFTQMHHIQRAAYQNQIRLQKMDGNIGIIANGNGLGLATMDLVAVHGGKCGGLVDLVDNQLNSQIQELMLLFCDDDTTKVILVN
jgi:succinyl-CoA synthetase beta subunit